tara:strand:- start:5478 stop:6209 length:732 start_codon:yes stop_codon:yes gene_type:complete
MPKKVKMRLPNEILALPNADKLFHEKWKKGRNMLNIPHPFRCVALGPPNCGKGTIIKNLLLRAKPAFEEVFVIHCDPDYTKEWDDIGGEMMSEIPNPEDWKGEVKTLVILDDLEFKGMSRDQKRNLDRLFGFVSTHKNISIVLAAQDTFNVPPIVRRCSNLWVLWKMNDMDSLSNTARKTGMSAQNFNTIFNELMMNNHDSLWIDTTAGTPYPLRKNGYTIINKKDGEESKKMLDKMDTFTEE